MVKETALYDLLQVSPNANQNEIKKAYRRASIKWHPDKNLDNKEEATKKFQEISEAYTILSDTEKRKQYDNFGIDFFKNGGNSNMNVDPMNIFEQVFGNMGGFPGMGGFHMREKRQNEDLVIEQVVTLDQIYNEEKITINYQQKCFCKVCDGFGTKSKSESKCGICGGKGKTIQVRRIGPMVQQILAPCNNCRGTGRSINKDNRCEKCGGKTFILKDKKITIPLKNGLTTGHKIHLENKGHYLKSGRTNLIIVILEKQHPIFKRHNFDLIIDMEIPLYQSLLGFTRRIIHLDKRKIYIQNNELIKTGDIKRVMGEGLRNLNNGDKGDLIIRFNIKYPDLNVLSEKDKQLLKIILSKTEIEELKREKHILKNSNPRKILDLYDIKEDEEEEREEEQHVAECNQQ